MKKTEREVYKKKTFNTIVTFNFFFLYVAAQLISTLTV